MIVNDNKMTSRWAGQVRRYHTWPVIRQQTIGEHSWNLLRMYYEIFDELPERIAVYLVYHDVPELKVGDPPYPIKKDNPTLKMEMDRLEQEALDSFGIVLPPLSVYEKLRVKVCDGLDCWEYAREEIAMGNTTFHVVVTRIKKLMEELIPQLAIGDVLRLQKYWTKMGLEGVYQDACNPGA